MNKTIFSVILMTLLLTSIAAAGVGNPDVECQAHGFDYGIAKYGFDGSYTLDEGIFHGYSIAISKESNAEQVIWKASPAVAGVLLKTSSDHYVVAAGGTTGTAVMDIEKDISHVTFCGDDEEVPEFGVFAALGVLGLAGLFVYRKRH